MTPERAFRLTFLTLGCVSISCAIYAAFTPGQHPYPFAWIALSATVCGRLVKV